MKKLYLVKSTCFAVVEAVHIREAPSKVISNTPSGPSVHRNWSVKLIRKPQQIRRRKYLARLLDNPPYRGPEGAPTVLNLLCAGDHEAIQGGTWEIVEESFVEGLKNE